MQYQTIPLTKLTPFPMRDIRPGVVAKLEERIKKTGFNPARPLSVVKSGDMFIVADGNHRLEVLRAQGIEVAPCLVYDDADPYPLAIRCNQDEDTYAPMDLFDWLDVISALKTEGLTQKAVGEKIGWSNDYVSKHCILVEKISTEVLKTARCHQSGRVDSKSTCVDFTEGWFRNSGLYDLGATYQPRLLQDFIDSNCSWSAKKTQIEAAKYKLWQEMCTVAAEELQNKEELPGLVQMIESGTFTTVSQLRLKVSELNKVAQNRLICGDAVSVLETLEDGVIDLVITDPPYGIEYKSNRGKYSDNVAGQGIENDGKDEAMSLLDRCCEVLDRKSKPDAHFYFFCGWQTEPEFRAIISRRFNIQNVIIWDKGNHGAGDLDCAWGNRYEMIIFAIKGRKKLVNRLQDIISVPKISSDKLIHPTQKPTMVIHSILSASARKADMVVDPFMGSGSTIKAIRKVGSLSYVGIELDRDRFQKAEAFINAD